MVWIPLGNNLLEVVSEDEVPSWHVDVLLFPVFQDLGLGHNP